MRSSICNPFFPLAILVLCLASPEFSLAQSTVFTNGVQDKRPETYAFTHVTLFIDYQTKIENATLVIKDGVVVAAGTNVAIPSAATIEDLAGAYIYPSFIDLHTDFGLPEVPKGGHSFVPQYTSGKKGAYSWNQAIKPEINAVDLYKYNDAKAIEWRRAGFGTVLTHYKDGISRGTSALVLLSEGKEVETLLVPKAGSHFSFSKGNSTQEYPTSLMGAIALLRQTYYDAEWYAKNHTKETNLSLQAINDQKQLPWFFETSNKLNFLRADKLGDEFGKQYIIKGSGDEYQIISDIKATQAKVVLPINFPKAYDVEDPFISNHVGWSQLKHWEMAVLNPSVLEKNGVSFSLTLSDLTDKKEFFKNLRQAIYYGLSEKVALKALTYGPASFIGQEKQIGQLKPGFLANFIIASGNIFEEGNVINENWVRGKKYIVNERPLVDIRGKYKLKIGEESEYKLVLKGKKETPEITVSVTDSLTYKSTFSLVGYAVSISISRKKDSISQDLRLTGNYANKQLEGYGSGPDGKLFRWKATYSDTVSLPKPTPKPVIDSFVLLSKVRYPFVGYGYETKPKAETILIKNATVLTSTDKGTLVNTDVLLKDGKIAQIGKGISALGAKTIDGTDKFVTAGIIDEHSHIAAAGGVNEAGKSVSAEVRIGDVLDNSDINIFRQLAGGVTAVQVLHGSANCIGGQSGLIKLRWGELPENLKIAGADGYIKFALGENVKQSNWGDFQTIRYPQTRMGVEQTFADAFVRAKSYQKEWKAFSDSKGKLPQPKRDLELEAIVEILEKKRFITCHSYVQSEVNMLIHLADSLGFKVNTFTHILDGYKVADKIAKHGASGSTFGDWWAYKMEVMDAIPHNAYLLHKNRVNTIINSDDPEMGRRLNQEAAKSIKYTGLDATSALNFVTINPAKALHLDKRMGSISEGKDADVVVWSADPLTIDGIPEYTIVDGIIYYDRAKAKETKTELDKEKNRLIQKSIIAKRGGEPVQPAAKKKAKNYECDTIESDYLEE